MAILYVFAVITVLLGIVSLLQGIQSARYMRSRTAGAVYDRAQSLKVTVFCPCKGVDPEFEENIRSILDQDYPGYRVHFIVESQEDPACDALRQLGVTKILVAGQAKDRGQKVHNLAYGVGYGGRDCDVLVFCDSDARYPPDWLSNLVPPLAGDAAVGAATGYRWYVPRPLTFPNLLRSAWNAVAVSALGNPRRCFAWGGSLAIRRETFERIGVLQGWQGSVSDDYAITRAVQAAGLKIVFVPRCLIPSYGNCGWADLAEFTTRQMIITRVYYNGLWRAALVSYSIFNVTFIGLTAAALTDTVAAAFWMAIYGLTVARSWLRYDSVKSVLSPGALSSGWFYILCAPLVSMLYLYNVIRSGLTTDIVWRGIHYKLVSPRETRVTTPCARPPAKTEHERSG